MGKRNPQPVEQLPERGQAVESDLVTIQRGAELGEALFALGEFVARCRCDALRGGLGQQGGVTFGVVAGGRHLILKVV